METIKDLDASQAAKKLKDMVEDIRVCMFFTCQRDQQEQGRPMSVAKTDDQGNIRFLADKNSAKIEAIQEDNKVHLVFSHPGKEMYLDVYGDASLSTDQEEIEAAWSSLAKAWFPEGKTDPNICVIKIKAQEGKYWDTQHGKMLEFIKVISAAITGTKQGDGVRGAITLTN